MDYPSSTRSGSPAGTWEARLELFPGGLQYSKDLPPARLRTLFFAGLALICGATTFIGVVPTRIYGHDIFIYLGNGWRIINGQRPHVDFTSPWGPIGFLISALGLTISRYSANGIGYGSAIVALIVGSWCFLLGKGRLTSLPRLILSLFLAALVAAPYPLGLSYLESSHAMIYNRYGYGLLGLVLLECFAVPRIGADTQRGRPGEEARQEWIGGISTGLALGLMLFLKVSYFLMAAALLVVIALLLRRFPRQRAFGMALAFALVSICVLGYLHFDLTAVIADLRMAAGARAETIPSPIGIAMRHLPVLLGVILFGFSAGLSLGNLASPWRGQKLLILGAVLFFADVAIISGNAQLGDFPICAVFAILAVNEITKEQQGLTALEADARRPAYAALLSLGALLFLPLFASDLTGLAYGVREKARPPAQWTLSHFTSPDLKPVLLYESTDNPPSEGRMFTNYVNDGVALLQRETRPDELILTMDVTNPFPFALGRRPPRGGHAAVTYHYNITDDHRPTDDWYFGDADIVMVPKRPSQGDNHYVDFYKAYGPGLKQRYSLAAESSRFWMYRRK